MKECYAVEGVNYITECKDVVDKYMEAQRVRIRDVELCGSDGLRFAS